MPSADRDSSVFKLNPEWVQKVHEQLLQASPNADLPWALQWARRNHLYSFQNLTVWGLGLAARHPGLGWVPLDGLAHVERRMAAAHPALELDGDLFYLAVAAIQPDHALPTAHLSDCWQ